MRDKLTVQHQLLIYIEEGLKDYWYWWKNTTSLQLAIPSLHHRGLVAGSHSSVRMHTSYRHQIFVPCSPTICETPGPTHQCFHAPSCTSYPFQLPTRIPWIETSFILLSGYGTTYGKILLLLLKTLELKPSSAGYANISVLNSRIEWMLQPLLLTYTVVIYLFIYPVSGWKMNNE